MIKIICIVLLLISVYSACLADEWTRNDTYMQIAYSGLHMADWNQTLQIIEDDKRKEANKILGQYPSKDRVNLYFTTTLVGHYYISKNLKQPYRAMWQILWIGRQLKAVNHNRKAGLHINFKF